MVVVIQGLVILFAGALQEHLERERRMRDIEDRRRDLRAAAERCATLMGPGPSAVEHGDFLYDERGLPR